MATLGRSESRSPANSTQTGDSGGSVFREVDAGPDDPDVLDNRASDSSAFLQLAGTLRDLSESLDVPFESFYEPPSAPSLSIEDELELASRTTSAEVQRVLDEYEELDIGSLDTSVREGLQRLVGDLLQRRRRSPKRVKMHDKLLWVLGTCDLWASAFWLGKSPATFDSLYTWKAVLLFSLRWIYYRSKRWHYYMWDFCYAANVLLLVALNFLPTHIKVFKTCFAFSLGPVAWSILTFRNSLVYHSLDKLTTVFLHLYPACACWAARWYPSPAIAAALEGGELSREDWDDAKLLHMVGLPMLPYLLWAVLYYCKIFIASRERISQRGYDTLFKYITKRPVGYARLILSMPEKWQPLVYMGFHLAMTCFTMALCKLWWEHFWAGSLFIAAMFVVAAWNGANYYFEVFSRRYINDLGLQTVVARAARSQSGDRDASGKPVDDGVKKAV